MWRASAEKTISEFPGPTLRPVSDSDPACPDISGNYRSKRIILNLSTTPLDHFPKERNQNGMSVHEEILRGEPIQRGGGIGGTYYYHELDGFHRDAIWGFEQRGKTLTVTLMDAEWTSYMRMTYGLDHPMIGCHDGALYIRTTAIIGGTEGSMGGEALSTEQRIRRLPNGDLEIESKLRIWDYSYYVGLLGYDPVTKKPGGSEPRRSEWTNVFPGVKQAPPLRDERSESPKGVLPTVK
jgi:hypothetical protein